MVDFKKLLGGSASVDNRDPIAIHKSLDSAVSHTYLRDVQKAALEELTARRSERDLIIKMSTGSGKTAVGLLMLKSYMAEARRPGVYLCPTKQLRDQVLREARFLGLAASAYDGRHPPDRALTGDEILVLTYQKLFNAKSVFDRSDVQLRPVAIVLDDAHSGIDSIRRAFSASWDSESAIFMSILPLLESALREQAPGRAEGIFRNDELAILEAPYWSWRAIQERVRSLLAEEAAGDGTLQFSWGYIRDDLERMRVLVSGKRLELSCEVLPIRVVKAYSQAPHRMFMSATLADDAPLVRDLGCDVASARTPVSPSQDRGTGERMVLVPSLVDPELTDEVLTRWIASLASIYRTVVLTPSRARANVWEELGATVASGDEVQRAVEDLRSGAGSFVAIPNRYDGIDLPDDACRVLVLDGLPTGETLYERLDLESFDGVLPRRVHQVEQGMGRAVRGPADYAVVILLGRDLATFSGRHEVRTHMSATTQAQLDLARKLADLARDETGDGIEALTSLVHKCLRRDPDWKAFYKQEVATPTFQAPGSRGDRLEVAQLERQAADLVSDGAEQQAAQLLQGAANRCMSKTDKAQILQRAARYLSGIDPSSSAAIQKKARELNSEVLKPPSGIKYLRREGDLGSQAARALAWLNDFDHPNAALLSLDTLKTKLEFSQRFDVFEAALCELGRAIGACSERPEHEFGGKAPDGLWLFAKCGYILEAKSASKSEVVSKSDFGQLFNSREWFSRNYPELVPIPILVHPSEKTDPTASPTSDMRLMSKSELASLLENVRQYVTALSGDQPLFRVEARVRELLVLHRLSADQLKAAYTRPAGK